MASAATQGLITDPGRIARHLQQLCLTRTPLQLRIGDHPDGHPGLLLLADALSGHLLADTLRDPQAHQRLLDERRLQVLAGRRGRGLCFETRLETLESLGPAPAYRLRWPSQLREWQRRAHFRVPTPRLLDLQARLQTGEGDWIQAGICDLSAGGVGLILPARPVFTTTPPLQAELDPGDDEAPLRVGLIPQRLTPVGESGRQRLGASFADLGGPARREWERRITALQRRLIRLTPGQ